MKKVENLDFPHFCLDFLKKSCKILTPGLQPLKVTLIVKIALIYLFVKNIKLQNKMKAFKLVNEPLQQENRCQRVKSLK